MWTKSKAYCPAGTGDRFRSILGPGDSKRHQHLRVPGVRLLMEMTNIAITTAVVETMPTCARVEDRFVSYQI